MLTLKLKGKDGRTRIIECGKVDVIPCERTTRIEAHPENKPVEVYVVGEGDGDDAVIAFVENSAGATSQIVRPGR